MEILNVFNTLNLIQISWNTRTFFKKLPCQKPLLRQIEWQLQNWPITKSEVLPVFVKLCFGFGCTNHPNVHIRIFCNRWSLLLGCFLPVSIPNNCIWRRRYWQIFKSAIVYIYVYDCSITVFLIGYCCTNIFVKTKFSSQILKN